ncbi:isochorismatase family cysteine hydrolase [Microtetraspora sp. NBRC 13810]|uniref:cysteine hydrolase family protein n=1 Tax=Microtetraspora sp. NBRC 13810 TaxID=3030990 RepID=UPI0025557ED4|nr:isochorismatase family cysteine hydrolase [Microtetraspora sp. NBRC 13810]
MTRTAVVVVDMLNPYDHDDADLLQRSVREVVRPLAGLVRQAWEREDVELIFVNDNHGDFSATREQLQHRALNGRFPQLVAPVPPPLDCAFMAKVRHSAFYGTPLEYLLRSHGVDVVVLAGQVTEQCVLYSALDAYVREFSVRVARDCVAHIHADLAEAALRLMERNIRAELLHAAHCLNH